MQELYCHYCRTYNRFPTDKTINGNVIIVCRKCGHQHCRYVIDGQITKDRWGRKWMKAPRRIRAEIARKDALSIQKSSGDDDGAFLRQSWFDSTGDR